MSAGLAFGLGTPGSHRVAFFVGAFGRSARVSLGSVVVEHEKAQHCRQIGMLTLVVDRGDKVWQQDIAGGGDFLEGIPECIFKAHACRMPVYFDRSVGISIIPQSLPL
jgi:hypothetical protein